MNRDLPPIPSRKWRLSVLIALWALALIGTTSWPAKLGFVLSTAAVFGTWRRFRVSPKSLKQRCTVEGREIRSTNLEIRNKFEARMVGNRVPAQESRGMTAKRAARSEIPVVPPVSTL